MTPFLLALPWAGLLAFVLFVVRQPRELPPATALSDPAPMVSVVIPARNEAANIANCVESVARSRYPSFEIIVVDDRSEDDTAVIARGVEPGAATRIVVVEGEVLPEGWLGKPWACHQGADEARGDLLLFTDADTTHEPDLLARAVAGLEEEGADLLTVIGRQIMGSFWERLIQPQVFLMMVFRFPRFEAIARNDNWRDAIANGQYMLFPRASYEAIGGHVAVQDEVVEDLVLAQVVKRAGRQLRIRGAVEDFATRMYRSLPEMIEGWSKNIVTGGLQSVPAQLRPIILPASLLAALVLWIVPPVGLALALMGVGSEAFLTWSATVCFVSVGVHGTFTRIMGASPAYGLLYPLGAAVGTYIFLRSWVRGRTVEWKGRTYTLPAMSDRP